MKKQLLVLSLMSLMSLSACGGSSSSSEKSIVPTSSVPASSVVESSVKLSETSSAIPSSEVPSSVPKSSVDYSNLPYVEDLLWFPELKLEVDQIQYINNYMMEFEDSEILIPDESMLSFKKDYLTAHKEGDTYIVYHANGKYQKVNVNIAPKGTYDRAYTFEEIGPSLEGKKCANFGDSISFDWTLGDQVSTYSRRFAKKYGMEMGPDDNHAIGGSVSMYVTNDPNVMTEYGGTEYQYNDGVDQFHDLYLDGTLKDYSVIFITFGYNDLYFQPEIDDDRDHTYNLDPSVCCHSWKGGYRYMINTARKANPDVKIVIQNIIYNEYDLDHGGYSHNPKYSFDKGIKYLDFRKALYEIGYELDVKVIDMWNYTKSIYDYSPDRDPTYLYWKYKDIMHPSVIGNKYICNYLVKW